MYEIVMAFGTLTRKLLEASSAKVLRKQGRLIQCSRLEIDRVDELAGDKLDVNTQELRYALIRRAVFIEIQPGLSRHQSAPTMRWQLRRAYLPAFRAPLSKSEAVKKDADWFEWFLRSPSSACNNAFASMTSARQDTSQQFKFTEQGEA